MAERQTEQLHPAGRGIDMRPPLTALGDLLDAQVAALAAVRPALPALEQAAALMARCLSSDGRLIYAGAGSSALMANADGLELSGSFGIDPARILLLMAGGLPTDARMPGESEDDAAAGEAAGADLGQGDLVIAVTASGATPFPLGLAQVARGRGAAVVAIANNAAAPIFATADVAVALITPPEVIAGSTRLGAATAQKVALNLISTMAAIRLGHVHDGLMVGVRAENAKLRERAARMVAAISGADAATAAAALAAAGGQVREAVLIARGASPVDAARLLAGAGGRLRGALASLDGAGPGGGR